MEAKDLPGWKIPEMSLRIYIWNRACLHWTIKYIWNHDAGSTLNSAQKDLQRVLFFRVWIPWLICYLVWCIVSFTVSLHLVLHGCLLVQGMWFSDGLSKRSENYTAVSSAIQRCWLEKYQLKWTRKVSILIYGNCNKRIHVTCILEFSWILKQVTKSHRGKKRKKKQRTKSCQYTRDATLQGKITFLFTRL